MNPWNRGTAEVQTQSTAAVDAGLRSYMLKVYNLMTSGVLLTGIIAYFAGNSQAFLNLVISQNAATSAVGFSPLGWIIAFAPVAMVFLIGFRARHMSPGALKATFFGYAALMGLSLFSIFLVYTGASILKVFFITAGTFGLLSMYGYTTKKDLTSWGTFLMVGIWAIFLVSLVNVFFLKSSGLDIAMSYIGVLLALGLTAYDTQKVKEIYYTTSGEGLAKASTLGALSLYFDFIYLFINLLRIMGDRR